MLHFVVFCLDRPLLCDHLLKSIKRYLASPKECVRITLLYGATESRFQAGFDCLRERYGDRITFVQKFRGDWRVPLPLLLRPRNLYYFLRFPYYREGARIFNFKPLLQEIIAESSCEFVAFLTDDSFFYREVDVARALGRLDAKSSSQNSFSLRHGLNIRNPPSHLKREEEFVEWKFASNESDGYWSYRFSIDGHIYNRRFLLDFIRNILFINPNTFEGVVNRFAECEGVLKHGHGFTEAVLAGAEINRVQNVSANNNLGIDNKMLNDYYLKGFRLELLTDRDASEFHPGIRRLALKHETTGEECILLDKLFGS